MKTSDFLVERLLAWGVTRVFGYPGDGINGILGGLQRSGKIEFIQVRHEESAAFMACAHAKFTGEPGVCLATSGPGAIHLLNGLYDAKGDHVPVVAIVGQAATTAIGGDYQQEVNLTRLFADVAHEYVYQVNTPGALRHVVDRAFRTAWGDRAVTCVIVPKDVQEMDAVPSEPHKHDTIHSSAGFDGGRLVPNDEDLRRAAAILNAAERPALLVGAGALRATDEVMLVAERLGAGVAKALLGKAAVPDDFPLCTGTIGLLGTGSSSELMRRCDALLMVGTTFPYGEFLPKEGQARAVQIDVDPRNLGIRYPTELNMLGDAQASLRALLPLLNARAETAWADHIRESIRHWREVERARAFEAADPINPQRVFYELSDRLPERAILTGDAGTATNWYARHVMMRRGMMGSLSGGLATMGSAVPYAIAAKFAYPERTVIACTGDGAMQMNGINELLTVSKYWRTWSNPRLVFLVLHNDDLNQVTWEMRILSGDPKYDASQRLPEFSYAGFAESIGLRGIRVDTPEQVGPAWDEALRADRPVVYDAVVAGDVATLPPHITFDQATKFARAMLKGDPERSNVIEESLKGILDAVLPR